jgi:hypothetical protein
MATSPVPSPGTIPAVVDGAFRKFAQFQKVEDSTDGQPTVWGIATQQEPDLDGEVCDYDSAKQVYSEWSAAAAKRTAKAGQKLSLGNIRLQHGLDIGGKATKLDFDDKHKQIWLGSEPINDQVRGDLKDGFYTGYSQGGSYAWRKCMECGENLPLRQGYNLCTACDTTVKVLYGLKSLAEVSYVDSPCSGEGFEHVKADGSREIVKFAKRSDDSMQLTEKQIDDIVNRVNKAKDKKTKRVAGEDLTADCFAYVGDPEKTDTWKLPIKFSDDEKTKRHIRNALARFDQTKGIPEDKKDEVKAKIVAAAKKNGIDVEEEGQKTTRILTAAKAAIKTIVKERLAELVKDSAVEKGLYEVARFADFLESLSWMYLSAVYERDMEGDESEVPDDIEEILHDSIEVFIAMATEEATELAARTVGKSTGGNMTPEEMDNLNKAAKKTHAHHFAKMAAHHEKMADNETKKAEHHEKMADAAKEHMDKCKACKADVGSGEPSSAIHSVLENQQEFSKAVNAEHSGMASASHKAAKAHMAMADHCHKMAEDSDKDEHDKTVKAIKDADAAEPAAVVKVATQNDADVEFARKAREKADAELMNDAEFMKEVKEKRRKALLAGLSDVSDDLEKVKKESIVPDGVKAADFFAKSGLRVVEREQENFQLAGASGAEAASTGGV